MKRKSLNSFFNNKKGDFSLDLLLIVVVIIAVGLSWMFLGDIYDGLNTQFQEDSLMGAEAKANLQASQDGYNSNFDGLLAFIFFGMSLFVIISSWFLDSHPVFFVVTLIMMTIIVSVVVVLANTVEGIVTDESLVDTSNEFPMTMFIYEHIIGLILGIAFISAISMYGKFRGGF